MYFKIFLITFYLFIIILESFNSKSTTIYYKKQSINHPSKDIYANISCEECLKKNIFFPEYQNKYSRINELNDTNFNFIKVKNNRSVTLVPQNLIDGNEKQLEIDKITKLINKIEKNGKNDKNSKNYQKIKMKYMEMITFFIAILIRYLTTIILSINTLKKIHSYMKRPLHLLKI